MALLPANGKKLVEHLPGQNQYEILRRNIIDRVADDYDFIFIDTGPHWIRSCSTVWRPATICCLPLPHQPGVDFHSTLKYLTRLPEMLEQLEEEGVEPRLSASVVLCRR